jgi:hypothetical protein
LCLELRDIRTTTGGPIPFAGGFNEKLPIPAKAASDRARQINRLLRSPGASPRFWRNTRKATLAIEASTEKFAVALLSLEIVGSPERFEH